MAEMLHVPADRDTTLIEDPTGGRTNGAAPAVFAGRTGQGLSGSRRGLMRFDVAAVLPERAIIDRVFVSLYQTSTSNTAPHTVTLHRVLEDWSEGPGFSSGSGGVPADTGDVTWLYTDQDLQYWVCAGGH